MVTIFLILCSLYISYITSVKYALRFYMFKRPVYDWIAYAAALICGGIAGVACSLPVILNAFLDYPVWQLAILPTLLAIGIGESLYNRNKKWTEKLIHRQWKMLEQQSRTKRSQ